MIEKALEGCDTLEKNLKQLNQFQLSIAEDMIDWVRVIDRDNNILYVNRKMKEDLHEDFVGKKCFEVFCKNKKCEHCISGRTLQNGSIQKKEEMLNGSTYTVISSPMYDQSGEIVGSVEVFRDVTNEKSLAKKLSEKNKKMSDDISFARNMQERMLPPKGMYNGVMTDYLYESSELLSGDFFDVFKVDNNNTAMYICDVVGHGVSASLLTIFVRQSLRTLS
jgi:sigma-B regulation protein RsbU (phosphoserine phosphatase)